MGLPGKIEDRENLLLLWQGHRQVKERVESDGDLWVHKCYWVAAQRAESRPSAGCPDLTASTLSGHWMYQGPSGENDPSFWHLRPCPASLLYHCAPGSPRAFSTLPIALPHLTAVFEPKYHFHLSRETCPADLCSPHGLRRLPVSFLAQTLPHSKFL